MENQVVGKNKDLRGFWGTFKKEFIVLSKKYFLENLIFT
jgi:hypothetical protein